MVKFHVERDHGTLIQSGLSQRIFDKPLTHTGASGKWIDPRKLAMPVARRTMSIQTKPAGSKDSSYVETSQPKSAFSTSVRLGLASACRKENGDFASGAMGECLIRRKGPHKS